MTVDRVLVPGKTYFATIKQNTFASGFYDDACKEFYLRRLLHCQRAFSVRLHAYLLLDQEIFLLLTPQTPRGYNSFSKFLNKSYSKYFRDRFSRKIEVWQNNPQICWLPSEKLILDCQKFIERYVLSISAIGHPGEYRYSSYCENAFTHKPMFLQQQRALKCLVRGEGNGLERYRDFIAEPFHKDYERFLKSKLLAGKPLLSEKLLYRLEEKGSLTDI